MPRRLRSHANADGAGADGTRVSVHKLPDEIMCIIFSQQDAKTIMITLPRVCYWWREVCQLLQGVHLDFSWCTSQLIPVEALVGIDGGGGGGGGGASAAGQGLTSGLLRAISLYDKIHVRAPFTRRQACTCVG